MPTNQWESGKQWHKMPKNLQQIIQNKDIQVANEYEK